MSNEAINHKIIGRTTILDFDRVVRMDRPCRKVGVLFDNGNQSSQLRDTIRQALKDYAVVILRPVT